MSSFDWSTVYFIIIKNFFNRLMESTALFFVPVIEMHFIIYPPASAIFLLRSLIFFLLIRHRPGP